METMRWSLSDGRELTWDQGVLDGDAGLVELVEVMCDEPAELVVERGMGDTLEASIDDWFSAYWTILTALETAAEVAKVEVEAPPFPISEGELDQWSDATVMETPARPLTKKRAWLSVMLKARARMFASRSEAGRYAAYIRWSRTNGVEPVGVDEWKRLNSAGQPSLSGMDAIRGAIADLQADMKFMAKGMTDPSYGRIDAKDMTPEEYDKWSDETEAQGLCGQWAVVKSQIANPYGGAYDGHPTVAFMPTKRAVATMQKVQAIGQAIEDEVQRRAKERGIKDVSDEVNKISERLAKNMGEFDPKNPDLTDAAQRGIYERYVERSMGEYARAGKQLAELAAIRREVVSELVETGITPKKLTKAQQQKYASMGGPVSPQLLDQLDMKVYAEGLKHLPRSWVPNVRIGRGASPGFLPDENMVILPPRSLLASNSIFGSTMRFQEPKELLAGIAGHEDVHYSEYNNSGLRALVNTFEAHRTFGTVPLGKGVASFGDGTVPPFRERVGQPMRFFDSGYYPTYPDQYGDAYAGRSYSSVLGAPSKEILTVGLDHAYFGQYGMGRGRALDADYLGFVLGSLTSGG